jgi:predicted DsbA family dithiol-disulfide isomerase
LPLVKSLRIDVWSDVICPWCYVGKRRLEATLARFEHADAVRVVWRAFELDPRMPRSIDSSVSYVDRLARKYRVPPEHASRMIDRMTDTARGDGLDFRFDIARPGNTFDAHRLLRWSLDHGVQDALKERLFRAYMTEGLAIGDSEVLVELAADVGLDADAAAGVLASDTGAREVRADEDLATEMQVTGVPFFVFDGKYSVPGAQSVTVLANVLNRAWSEACEPEPIDEGAACGPDGC